MNHKISLKGIPIHTKCDSIRTSNALIYLETLYADNTDIYDISPLANLKKLQYLSLMDTRITDVSSLKNLYNLKELDIRRTGVIDISPLKNIPELKIKISAD